MTDQWLLLFGIGITFVFASGVYVYVRERFESGPDEAPRPFARKETEILDVRGRI